VTKQVEFKFNGGENLCRGYEIHIGKTETIEGEHTNSLNAMCDGRIEGHKKNDRCFGTYIHGILDNKEVIDHIIKPYSDKIGKKKFDYNEYKNEQYDKLADHIRKHIDMDKLYKIMQEDD
ncbi:MAG: cobyric acid synthase, partial [Bacteroides sp.]|nr:cobyric acid synthase [Bacteroides sp.]